MTSLRRWWVQKYTRPWTHRLFQEADAFDLLVEFYEDLFDKYPAEALKAAKNEDGEIVFDDVDDPLIQKWEEELAAGLTPDLEEGLAPAEKERLRKEREKHEIAKKAVQELTAPSEELDPKTKKLYQTKSIVRGSEEELELLKDGLIGFGDADEFDPEELLGYKKR